MQDLQSNGFARVAPDWAKVPISRRRTATRADLLHKARPSSRPSAPGMRAAGSVNATDLDTRTSSRTLRRQTGGGVSCRPWTRSRSRPAETVLLPFAIS